MTRTAAAILALELLLAGTQISCQDPQADAAAIEYEQSSLEAVRPYLGGLELADGEVLYITGIGKNPPAGTQKLWVRVMTAEDAERASEVMALADAEVEKIDAEFPNRGYPHDQAFHARAWKYYDQYDALPGSHVYYLDTMPITEEFSEHTVID